MCKSDLFIVGLRSDATIELEFNNIDDDDWSCSNLDLDKAKLLLEELGTTVRRAELLEKKIKKNNPDVPKKEDSDESKTQGVAQSG